MSKGKLNIHIYPTLFQFESRILKETSSIIRLGLAGQVIILARGKKEQQKTEKLHNSISVIRFISLFSSLPEIRIVVAVKYLEFYIRVFFWMFLRKEITIINCHSLMVLPLGFFMKLLRKKIKLIYDPHELETERNGLGRVAKKFSKLLERNFITKCDSVIVVGQRIKEWYAQEYAIDKIFVVRNTPRKAVGEVIKSDLLRAHFKIQDDKILFIYQGMLIKGRGLEILANVFRDLGQNYHLIIMGYGNLEPMIRNISKQNSNIHFHEAVAPYEIMKYTASCDVGISLIENTSLSYYYSLPNKVFEYLHAGLPVIVSAFPEMEEIVKQYRVGWAVNPIEKQLFSLIQKISKDEINRARKHVLNVAQAMNWENEEEELVKAFNN